MKKLKIAISGELGSGKSVLSKKLSAVLSMDIISVGKVQRQLAEKYGMTTVEFNRYMESHPEIDNECDDMVTAYGASDASLILDSRMAWNFVPHSFKIHLLVDSTIAAKRIFNDTVRKNEKYGSIVDARNSLIERKNSETLRFKKQYNVDIDDFSNYDLIIDTTYASPETVFEKVTETLKLWQEGKNFNSLYLSPKSLLPTQGIREHKYEYTKDISASIKKYGFFDDEPVSVIKYLNKFFIFDGHKRTSVAIFNNYEIIPAKVVAKDDEDLPFKQSVSEFVKFSYTLSNVYDWEAMHKFNFPEYLQEIK